ncbi:MAG: hypothetical protein NC489_27900 [Ruminococcus flavefaciens]|nr:hypothetical protein [Ruminococcus flavefaciens]
MSDLNGALNGVCAGIESIIESNSAGADIGTFTLEENIAAVMAGRSLDEPCVCGARVMCNNATEESVPAHIVKDGERIELGGLAELNKKDIRLDIPFAGCRTSENNICRVKTTDIEDEEWKDVDTTKNQGEDKENLKFQSSYMVCTKEWGILYFIDAGQQVKDFVDELSVFLENLQEQFGFDRRTIGIIGEVYRKIQEKYADKPQKERDWYFARALSQMGDYDKKLALGKETDAWVKGAGKVYEHGEVEEKIFFCEELGIDEADYKYMRQMIRLQHYITSNSEGEYAYDSVCKKSKKNKKDFRSWKKTMEEGIGEELEDDEYLALYKQIYDAVSQKGDFSHMLYTISANLIDEGHGVENQWDNVYAPETSWNSAEERKDVTGWLGDAVYDGPTLVPIGKVSFGEDDYIADLDADNIAAIAAKEQVSLLTAVNTYYTDLQANGDEYRTQLFMENNTYEEIESTILEKVELKDVSWDKKANMEDLEKSGKFQDTCIFLKRLEKYRKP